jgi:hypothetical protein
MDQDPSTRSYPVPTELEDEIPLDDNHVSCLLVAYPLRTLADMIAGPLCLVANMEGFNMRPSRPAASDYPRASGTLLQY